MDTTIKNLGDSTYRIIADGKDIGDVSRTGSTWTAHPAVDGAMCPRFTQTTHATRKAAVAELVENRRS